jgi:hypothetical protein
LGLCKVVIKEANSEATASQFVLATSHFRPPTSNIFLTEHLR